MKTILLAAAGLLAVLGLSGGGYEASKLAISASSAASDPELSVCVTATAPTHTVGVDGVDVTTIPGGEAVACTTTTFTIPTTTVTTTQTVTTPATTTIATTTATPPPSSYDQAISYTQTRPPFIATRIVNVSSGAALKTAVSNLQPGDLVKATAPFTVTSSSGPALTIAARPASTAEIDLTGVTFVYTGGANENAVYLNNPQNLYIFGGNISSNDTGGVCLRVYGSQHVLWWGFLLHDCGSTGFQAQAIGGPVDHDDFQGEITKVGQNLAWDPHTEKGTGLHAANLWDANQTGAFSNNRFAFYAHDIPVGACIEFGNDLGTAPGNVLYLKCVNETNVSKVMTGGNGIQFCGGAMGTAGLDIKYIECQNLQGACVHSNTASGGVTVEYGRASNTNQNPQVTGGVWDNTHGIVYQDVQPAP
jgi:hypothetical protein